MATLDKQVQTKRMGNFDMAAAGDRIKAFWEKYPNGKIQLVRDVDNIDLDLKVFTTYIWKDKKTWMEALKSIPAGVDKETARMILLDSADADGPARQAEGKESKKDFEKLDTISAGRALAKLGFLKDGQVASTEEMENYYEYKDQKLEESADAAVEYLTEAKDLEDLRTRWVSIDGDVRAFERVEAKKEEMKKVLEEKAKKKADKK